ncbi:hypothetical protein [uncultured Hymenobacter sp.]|uniref:hypothetical protein n=1 Tax=uncultured Hymenobacter sp. TaxID=170016 RepID=UPI0035C98CDF
MLKNLQAPLVASAILLLGTTAVQAQTKSAAKPPTQAPTPQAMNYQGIARDLNGKPLQRQAVALRISVLAGGADAPAAYTETHRVTTTEQGSFSLAIGRGKASLGDFARVAWGTSNHFLRIEMDPTGGTNYRLMGTSELLSVPYALHAGSASTLDGTTDSQSAKSNGNTPGVPSQNWSLFGNSRVDPLTDRLGTTDAADLVLITNNLDRLTITSQGNVAIRNDLGVGNDLTVNRNVNLNTTGGATINNGPLTVARTSPTALTGTLNVTGATNLASTLNTVGATTLRNTLDVTGATNLASTLNTVGATTLRNTLGVTGATNLGSTLNTVGATTLRSTLGVDGATLLGSTLGVTGASTLSNTLRVAGATDLNNSLNTLGATTLRSTLGVTGAATMESSLTVAGTTTLNNRLAANGQVTITATMNGSEESYAAYPLQVQGSNQGIAIKLNAGTPNNTNNFITFLDGSGKAVGRIEGETSAEAKSDRDYIFNEGMLAAEVAKDGANVIAAAIPIVVGGLGASTGPCGPCLATAAADLVLSSANLADFELFALENLGVTYQSGSADYAEWLERSNASENIAAGNIVAVSGGKISKFTDGAQQFMVISTKPAVLGNMPPAGQEAAFEKVAFMGQIPVKVRGIVFSGDYILPSGLNDGTGVGVSPKEIKAEQYKQIVGVAWSESLVEGGIASVNMAIGLNANDLANLAVEQEKKIKGLESQFTSLEQRLVALEGGSSPKRAAASRAVEPAKAAPSQSKDLTRYELLVKNMPAELSNEVVADAIANLKDAYAKQGISVETHPSLNRLFTDASFQAEVIRKSQETYKASYKSILARSRE